jgi:hypothetical protein
MRYCNGNASEQKWNATNSPLEHFRQNCYVAQTMIVQQTAAACNLFFVAIIP